ncbi:hypothetical protein F3I02_23810 [Bacillus sp. SRB3LM]|nr:hypothetical protein [Bacillus sp. SRB3LM]MBG0969265.1 hypothetical protein [Bacillus sp. SRB3LM]MBG0971040.1 hypothetical protein [Bacillus sp. SRB3LM]MBG0971714.1 hypothetical protein [Bacillus sp. SRB3LM]
MENNGRSPNRAVVIERDTVDRKATKIFDERFQRGDYYVELECDRDGHGRPGRGEYEGSAFIAILG